VRNDRDQIKSSQLVDNKENGNRPHFFAGKIVTKNIQNKIIKMTI